MNPVQEDAKENLDPSHNLNEDMHSTFLNNNEQIIADLANLEIEQEQQIFRIIFNTFVGQSGLIEHEDL